MKLPTDDVNQSGSGEIIGKNVTLGVERVQIRSFCFELVSELISYGRNPPCTLKRQEPWT